MTYLYGHIINVDIPQSQIDMYQPGILNTVSHLGKVWGYPRAFSTKALFMNCDLLDQAGVACEGPETIYFCKKTNTINTGNTPTIDAAIISFHFTD